MVNIYVKFGRIMSKIGEKSIKIEDGVEVKVDGSTVSIVGPHGELKVELVFGITVEVKDKEVQVIRSDDRDKSKALHGTLRALINNAVYGVKNKYEKKLQLVGVGYRGKIEGENIVLSLGWTHPAIVPIPESLEVNMPNEEHIVVIGIDKQVVGEFAARIRGLRKPEPYKGKGVRYVDEQVRRKSPKSALVSSEA